METKFTMTNRRHHCRNCGKVCCGACSNVKAVLNQDKPERVCNQCHAKLGGKTPTDVPVLGKASTETHRRGSLSKTERRASVGSHGAGAMDSDDSSSSSSEDDDDPGTVV